MLCWYNFWTASSFAYNNQMLPRVGNFRRRHWIRSIPIGNQYQLSCLLFQGFHVSIIDFFPSIFVFFFVFFGTVFIFLLLLVNFLSDESGWRNGRVLYSLYPPEIPSFSVAFHVKSSFRGRPHVKTSSTTAATTTTTTNSENCNDHSKDIGYFISDWLRGPSFNFPAIWLFVLVSFFF